MKNKIEDLNKILNNEKKKNRDLQLLNGTYADEIQELQEDLDLKEKDMNQKIRNLEDQLVIQ